MEVIEDGNIMDRIPILLQRDLEYYQKNQIILSETVCRGVVGGRLDFPRNASFAAAKIVLWLEDEFSIAFNQGSGMFVTTDGDEKNDGGVAKTSDPDKFVQMAVKSSDALLEHLHTLAQEALDHADLPVLTATLGAAALIKNSLYCYLQHVEDMGSSERLSMLQACYKRYVTMSEAVAERVLDLHNRVLSLYILQDAGGRPIDDKTTVTPVAGTPSVQGWWLYMSGSRKDLWDTVPPRMAQRIFAGMLNETLTILTVRYCQSTTTETTTPLLINDILNILLCVAQLLPCICRVGSELAGISKGAREGGANNGQAREVRDVHAKCGELLACLAHRGAGPHLIKQVLAQKEVTPKEHKGPQPWFIFVSPNLFDPDDETLLQSEELPTKTALGLDLVVLLAQPQSSWTLLVKVLLMRNCHLARMLLAHAIRHMSADNSRWPADGLWYSVSRGGHKCDGFLCTADGFCTFKSDSIAGEEYARAAGALTYIIARCASCAELRSALPLALELCAADWPACLDKRQVWCDRRPPWLAAILALSGSALQFIPPILVSAVQSGASMYQTMSLCLTCISRALDCLPQTLYNAASVIEQTLPAHINPVGGSVLLQMLITVTYEEILKWASKEAAKEKAASTEANGQVHNMHPGQKPKPKHVRISLAQNNTSSSVSFDGGHSNRSSIALAIAEALCSIDEDHKHTQELQQLVDKFQTPFVVSNRFGLEDFPEFAELIKQGDVPGSNAERASDAAALTSEILMSAPGRDSLRVIYDHIQLHAERIYKELGIQEAGDCDVPLNKAPLLYTMFHIGRRPFDQYPTGTTGQQATTYCWRESDIRAHPPPPTDGDTPARAVWGRPLEFILACLGYAVGLGNVWRFPYLCYRNGGGAFLLPFFLMLVFIGLPIFYLELYIGQYTGLGPLQAFSSISPFFSGLGFCTLVVISLISVYYMIIVAWTLFYTIVSLIGNLDWGSCENAYNTINCYSGGYDKDCRVNNTGAATDLTYFQRRCVAISEICTLTGYQPLNGTFCLKGTEPIAWYKNITRTLAAEEYYNERVLGRGDATWENWGSIQWHLVGTLFASWVIAFFCVIKGVQSAGKVVYFTALFPYVMLTALLIRGVTLEGAAEGIYFYLNPNWETLLDARVWGDAASQIFYSFGVACGSLITLASYNNFYNNCHFDAVFVSFANFITSIYAGFAIFSVLGFQAQQMGVQVSDVAEQGPGLAFVAYPEALLQMPIPQLWSILFFLMLFILGLGSQFAGIEAINTAIVDRWPHFRKRYWMVTAFTCFTCFILGIPMCFSGGVYLFTLLDWNTASWAVLLIGLAECVAVSWSYGVNRAMENLASMNMKLNKVLRFYWRATWCCLCPVGSFAILIFIFYDWKPPSYESYVFPWFADMLGWMIGLSTLVFFPIGVGWALYHGYRNKELFTPTVLWKPTVKSLNGPRSDSIMTMDSADQGPYDNLGFIM